MTINRQLIAKTGAFQHNCALNSLVHKLIPCIANNQVPRDALETFRVAFNEYYNSDLNLSEFTQTVSGINNPYHREIILAPVLRKMLRLPEVLAPYNEAFAGDPLRTTIVNPGVDLETRDIMPLANFFGIRLEMYSMEHFKKLVFARGNALSKQYRQGKDLSEIERTIIQAGINELKEPNPNFVALADKLLALAPPQLMNNVFVRNMARNKIVAELQQYYARTSDWDEVEHDPSSEPFKVQYRLRPRDRFPTLKLWYWGGGHFEYEDANPKLKKEHDDYYPLVNPNLYQYGCPAGVPNPAGSPDAEAVRNRIHYALKARRVKEFSLSNELRQYETEQLAARGAAPHHADANPIPQNANAANNKNDHVNGDASANPFSGFADLLKGGAFTDDGKEIFDAFMEPFKPKENSKNNMANDEDVVSKLMPGNQKGLLGTLISAFFGLHSFIMKIGQAFVGMVPAIHKMQAKANRKSNPAADLQASDLGNHPDGPLFAEYVKFLPDAIKGRLNSLWLNSSIPKTRVMDELRRALDEEGFRDELEFCKFKQKLQHLRHVNPVLHRHLLQQWQEKVYAHRHENEKELFEKCHAKKNELNAQVDSALKTQTDLAEALARAKARFTDAAADGDLDKGKMDREVADVKGFAAGNPKVKRRDPIGAPAPFTPARKAKAKANSVLFDNGRAMIEALDDDSDNDSSMSSGTKRADTLNCQ